MAIYGTLATDNILSIDASIADTAVDIFVYDTRKDSDGGAWRKRCQHTSWYNETLNTATRGSRREFPAVAVIVSATSSNRLTIYDGDDPNLPMWMIFTGNPSQYGAVFNNRNVISVVAINGSIYWADSLDSVVNVSFIKDNHTSVAASGSWNSSRNILDRNPADTNNLWTLYDSSRKVVAYPLNDVAMTILPNAPIDPSTGLPIPTIAVATDGGVSVIRDDGNVVDITASNIYKLTTNVSFDGEKIIWGWDGYSNLQRSIHVFNKIPSSDVNFSNGEYKGSADAFYGNVNSPDMHIFGDEDSITKIVKYDIGLNNNPNFSVQNHGIIRIHPNYNSPSDGIFANITKDFNTGWMHGDIKGAFLADTDGTSVTGSELVSNYNFDSGGTNWTTNLNGSNGGYIDFGPSALYKAVFVQGSNSVWLEAYQDITTVSGEKYVVEFEIASSNTNAYWRIVVAGTTVIGYPTLLGQGHHSYTFTASGATTRVSIQQGGGAGVSGTAESLSVRIADPDRSVNAKGLQVFGTITKSPVVTGAELVGYSGFSASNHLAQPYNSDLNPGSGSYSVVAWFKTESNNSGTGVITGLGNSDTDEVMIIYVNSTYGIYFDYGGGTEYVYLSNSSDRSMVRDGNWHQVVCQVTAGQIGEIYIDGIKKSTAQNVAAPGTWSQWDTNYRLYIGCGRGLGTLPFSGSISLVRYSLSKMSADQIRKIYEDEKVLFQENAKCTLYGSSDAVTALAYDEDTELLHVGTSSGRSEFKGLRRVGNTTTAVTTAISASNGLVAEQ